MYIKDIDIGKKITTLNAKVKELSPVKTFPRMGEPGKIAIAVIQDSTGCIDLTLWDGQTENIKEGDLVEIKNAKVKDYRGNLQITVGNKGSLIIKNEK